MDLPRHHPARPARGMGGLARGLPADATLQVVELARRIRADLFVAMVEGRRSRPRSPRAAGREQRSAAMTHQLERRRLSHQALPSVSALLFAASAAVTIVWCASMSAMG